MGTRSSTKNNCLIGDDLVEEEVDGDENDDNKEEDELDGLVVDEENTLVGVVDLGTKKFGDVKPHTTCARHHQFPGLAQLYHGYILY